MFSKIFGKLAMSVVALFAATQTVAMADQWKHLSLTSTESNQIQIDYQLKRVRLPFDVA